MHAQQTNRKRMSGVMEMATLAPSVLPISRPDVTDLPATLQAVMAATAEQQEAVRRFLQGGFLVPEPFLTLRRLSQQIGFGVTTLRRWQVPSHDLGGCQRYRLCEVQEYLGSEAFRRRQAALRAERRNHRAAAQVGFVEAQPWPTQRRPRSAQTSDPLSVKA